MALSRGREQGGWLCRRESYVSRVLREWWLCRPVIKPRFRTIRAYKLSHSISLSQTTFQCYCTMPISSRVHRQIVHLVGLLVTIIIPTLLQVIYALNDKEPYHTSLLSGEGWVQELLNGHPKRIRCELGVTKHVFQQLMAELHVMGYQDQNMCLWRNNWPFSSTPLSQALQFNMLVSGSKDQMRLSQSEPLVFLY